MSGTVKTVLIVGGIGLGAYVLAKALLPSTVAAKPGATAGGAPQILGGVFTSVSSLVASAFGSAGAANQPGTTSQPTAMAPASSSAAVYTPGDSFNDYTTGLFGPGINSDGTGASS